VIGREVHSPTAEALSCAACDIEIVVGKTGDACIRVAAERRGFCKLS